MAPPDGIPDWLAWAAAPLAAWAAWWKARKGISQDQAVAATHDGYRQIIEDLRAQVDYLTRQVVELRKENRELHREVEALRDQVQTFGETGHGENHEP